MLAPGQATRLWRWPGVSACGVALVVFAAFGLAGCGDLAGSATVVRVGNQAISKATADHWTEVVRRGGAFTGFRGKPRGGTARQRAIALLVSSSWLIGEASRQGVPVEQTAVQEALAERESESAGFQKRLHATGQTVAGFELETRAEFAGEAVRDLLAERADEVTQRQIVDFYRHNRRLFSTPEVRVTDLLENQPSAAAAAALVRRIGIQSKQFAATAYHEQVIQSPGFTRTPDKASLVKAIFAARPGAVSAPMPLNAGWAVFVVRKIIPPRPEALAKVRTEVITRLRTSRQQELKAKFDREYTERWRAQTKCRSSYIGPGCPQSKAQLGPYEDPFSSRAHPLLSEEGVSG